MSDRCETFIERLSPYMDGELAPAETRELEEHLRTCGKCRLLLGELKAAESLLRAELSGASTDRARADRALAATIERLRAEEAPAWAKPKRPPVRWALTLRWAAGLAAATVAVLLVLRVGTVPTAPVRQRSIPVGEEPQITASAEKAGPDAQTAPAPAAAPPPAAAKKAMRAEGGPGAPVAAATPAPPQPSPQQMQPVREAQPTTPPSRGGRATEMDLREAPQPPTAHPQSTWGSITRVNRGDESPRPPLSVDEAKRDWLMTIVPADTLGSTDGWRERLEHETQAMAAAGPAMAPRLRVLGDLWEWLGRRDGSSLACQRALDAYGRAIALDPQAAAVDSTRMRRARAGAQAPGNTEAPPR